jgi:hypothetical protein
MMARKFSLFLSLVDGMQGLFKDLCFLITGDVHPQVLRLIIKEDGKVYDTWLQIPKSTRNSLPTVEIGGGALHVDCCNAMRHA